MTTPAGPGPASKKARLEQPEEAGDDKVELPSMLIRSIYKQSKAIEVQQIMDAFLD
jgi:hypothetical protein